MELCIMKLTNLKKSDSEIYKLISAEEKRQKETINLIASENFVSESVLEALGSIFTNKYSEGYPGARYYGGNQFTDKLEILCQQRALKLFIRQPADRRKWSINVQPYSGSPANLAVYSALVPLGDPAFAQGYGRQGKIMGMRLDMGGHLTHGHKTSITGKLWKQISYGVNPKTEQLDYEEILHIAKKEKPTLIVCGYTAYSRIIDFKKFRKIADAVGAYLMVDMSHFAGLVAGGVYPSPFKYADVITTTTHKTLRGPRAALIFINKNRKLHYTSDNIANVIDKAVFPGLQGGPHMNAIAAVAVALQEATKPAFKKYAQQVVKNAKALALELQKLGWRIISDGTDTHLFLIDTWSAGISGKTAETALEKTKIIVNKNTIPFDKRNPTDPSGIRIGAAAITTRGLKEKDMGKIAEKINFVLTGLTKQKKHAKLK